MRIYYLRIPALARTLYPSHRQVMHRTPKCILKNPIVFSIFFLNLLLISAAGIFEIQKTKVSYPSHEKDDPSMTREGQDQEMAYPSHGWEILPMTRIGHSRDWDGTLYPSHG